MEPTIGRVVIFNTDKELRDHLMAKELREGLFGNQNQLQLPAMIVSVHGSDCVNLKVFIDGHSQNVWLTSRMRGDEEGQWNWPERK